MIKIYLPLIATLLFPLSCNAISSEYLLSAPAPGLKQITNSSPVDTEEDNASPEDVVEPEPEVPVLPAITFTYAHSGSGTRNNYNDAESYLKGWDQDSSTTTNSWNAVYTNSWQRINVVASRPFSGTLDVQLLTAVSNGYGNLMDLQVGCYEDGGFNEFFRYTKFYSNNSLTERTFSGTVTNCHTVSFYIKDVGKGSPQIRLADLFIEER